MATTLTLSKYKPNFNDPRTRKRALAVLAWCDDLRLKKNGKPVHHDELLKVYGQYRQEGLSRWLFIKLLSQSGQYKPGHNSFTYKLKQAGYSQVHSRLGSSPPDDVEIVKRIYGSILAGEAPEYLDKGGRRYHPVQNIQRDIRKKAFTGWWDYDIESCAPSLVYQYAVQHYRAIQKGSKNDPFPAVSRLINDKVNVRAHLVKLLGLDTQKAKELLAAIFFRANMAPSPSASVFSSLGGDEVRFQTLVNDEFVKQLRSDVKLMWGFARLHQLREQEQVAGKRSASARVKLSKQRMRIYLSLERRVMDAMLGHMGERNLSVLLMHDGFMSRKRLDVDVLQKAVLKRTGFVIRLSETELIEVGQGSDANNDADVVDLMVKDSGEADDELVGLIS